MTERLDFAKASPDAYKAMYDLKACVEDGSIDAKLRALVDIRVSQINGCVFCCDMHTQEARALGETQQRLDSLAVWGESPFFDDREKAALEWAENVTLLADTGVPDEVYGAARQHFSEKELVDLTYAVVLMNGWNRLAVGFHKMPKAR